jgi:hypothetical protein
VIYNGTSAVPGSYSSSFLKKLEFYIESLIACLIAGLLPARFFHAARAEFSCFESRNMVF